MMNVNRAPEEWEEEYDSFPKSVKTMQDFWIYTDRHTGHCDYGGVIDPETGTVKWHTQHEIFLKALAVGSHFLELGLNPGERIGVFCENRLESVIFLEAAQLYGFIVVFAFEPGLSSYPLFVFKDADVSCIYISKQKMVRVEDLLGNGKVSALKFLIVDEIEKDYENYPVLEKLEQKLISEFLECKNIAALPVVSPEDPCTICYSSGTIGAPKGIVLSNKSMVEAGWLVACSVDVRKSIIHVSYLPIAHILERVTISVIMYRGGRIAFATAGAIGAFKDMRTVKATAGPIIPVMLKRLDSGITETISANPVAKFLYKSALKISKVCQFFGFRSRLARWIIFDTIKARTVGPKIEFFVVAGDTFAKELHERLSAVFDMDLICIYGLSECAGAVTVCDRHRIVPGTVGSLSVNTEIKFSERNEILVKSSNLFQAYWNQPEVTKEAFENGWFRTGDKGCVDKHGNLIVTGRAYDILEFQPGVELAIPFLVVSYSKYMVLEDIYIYPFKEERALIAVCVTTRKWVNHALSEQLETDEEAEVKAKDPVFYEWMRRILRSHARDENLPACAYLAAVRCTLVPFSRASGNLLTATGKQRPSAFKEAFARDIEEMKEQVIKRHSEKKLEGDFVEYDEEVDDDE